MKSRNVAIEESILVLAPTGADGANVRTLLANAGFEARPCRDLDDVCAQLADGAGALLLAEEALRVPRLGALIDQLQKQPSWSDVPLIVITTGGDTTNASVRAYTAFGPSANLTLVERPFRAITLISTMRTALRSRRRQYEVRDLLDQLEEKVRERTTRLEQTVSELEAFSYSVSHDLRAPLRAMRGYSEILLQEYAPKLDQTGADYLKRILAASERLDRLVQDILRYSRCAREKIECGPVNLENLIGEVVGEYPAFHPPNAEVVVAGPLLPVWGHSPSLTQVISNLLSNAVKFVRPGRAPKIKIWTEPAGSRVRVLFNDNGIGIAPENFEKIFRMFERLTPGNQYDGTGIGLAIVAKAIERMGGTLGVDSVVGRGSTFWFELPAA
jgi:signal transduction histidine kinase